MRTAGHGLSAKIAMHTLTSWSDARGTLTLLFPGRFTADGRTGYVFTINADQVRGQHYHKKSDEWFAVLSGTCIVTLQPVDGTECMQFAVFAGNCFTVPPGVIHSFWTRGTDTCTVFACRKSSKHKNLDTYKPERI